MGLQSRQHIPYPRHSDIYNIEYRGYDRRHGIAERTCWISGWSVQRCGQNILAERIYCSQECSRGWYQDYDWRCVSWYVSSVMTHFDYFFWSSTSHLGVDVRVYLNISTCYLLTVLSFSSELDRFLGIPTSARRVDGLRASTFSHPWIMLFPDWSPFQKHEYQIFSNGELARTFDEHISVSLTPHEPLTYIVHTL